MSMTNAVPMMGIRSAVDPMSGCGSDAASRGATGSSASSAISLLPAVGTTGAKPTPTYASPTGNPLISPVMTKITFLTALCTTSLKSAQKSTCL